MDNSILTAATPSANGHAKTDAASGAAINPFDPARLRLSQNFGETVGVKKAFTTVPVRKPGKAEFVRVHPGAEMRLETIVIDLKDENETYLVDPSLVSELGGESVLVPKVLFTTITRQNVLLLWPITLPGEDGKHNQWHASALEAARIAEKSWIRVQANQSLGGYDVAIATGNLAEPTWPELSLGDILRIAFRDRYVDTMDHPVLRRLRGDI